MLPFLFSLSRLINSIGNGCRNESEVNIDVDSEIGPPLNLKNMDYREVQAEIHEGSDVRSIPPQEIGLEHGRTESICQPPPSDDDVAGSSSNEDQLVFGEDKEFLRCEMFFI